MPAITAKITTIFVNFIKHSSYFLLADVINALTADPKTNDIIPSVNPDSSIKLS
ncbi:hypothetical protein D356_00579 [Enterococcus faecium SD2A-2]|uniref:Uncharacterized protein n=1 Tax=Enterococcus faecium SD2A-2 TaxID=1244154 RepID=A0AB73ABW9_ENTFC|nr:hypothetical protein D356_00579 [Enterococcus faecium SD2A-2]